MILKNIYPKINYIQFQKFNYKCSNNIWYNNKLDLALYTRQELKFTNYKHNDGHNYMRYGIVGINLLVFLGWKLADEDHDINSVLIDYFSQVTTDRIEIDGTTQKKQRFFPNCFLTSFSHQDWGHLIGNIFFFWMLSKKLHQFLGFYKFMGLYLGGALFGSIASLYSPALDQNLIKERDQTRHLNQIQGQKDGFNVSLGASDSIMSLVAVFYFTFPRHQLYFSKFAYVLKMKQLRTSAIWLLPILFLQDFVSMYNNDYINNTTNYMAHIGGFVWGTIYYFAICRPLKQQYHIEKSFDHRRVYLMTISIVLQLSLLYAISIVDINNQTIKKEAIRFDGQKAEEYLKNFSLKIDQNKKILTNQQQFIKQNNIQFDCDSGIESIKLEDIFKQMEYSNICLKKQQESQDQLYNVPNYECDKYFQNLYNFANLLPDEQKHKLITNFILIFEVDQIPCKNNQVERIQKTGSFVMNKEKVEKLETA